MLSHYTFLQVEVSYWYQMQNYRYGEQNGNFVSWFYRISLLFTVYFLDLYSHKTFTDISKKSRYYFILVLAFQISSTPLSCNIFYNKKLSKKRRIVYVHFRNENWIFCQTLWNYVTLSLFQQIFWSIACTNNLHILTLVKPFNLTPNYNLITDQNKLSLSNSC